MRSPARIRALLSIAVLTALPLASAWQLSGPTLQFAAGGDLIGTLPAYYSPGGADAESCLGLDLATPSWQVSSSPRVLEVLVKDAWGEGFVVVLGPDSQGAYLLDFHGTVTIEVDRSVAERARAPTAVSFGPDFLGGFGYVTWNGHQGAPFVLGTTPLMVPVAKLLAAGVLDEGELTVTITSPHGRVAVFGLQSFGELVHLTQTIQ